MQLHEPSNDVNPAGHGWQAPPATENVPAGQEEHTLLPDPDVWPHGQLKQRDAPELLEYVPAAQFWQPDPSDEKVPGRQRVQSVPLNW